MAVSNRTNASRIQANIPARGLDISFDDLAELMHYLQSNLYVVDSTDTDDGKLSFGQTDPQGTEGREETLHVERDIREVPSAIRAWARTRWVDMLRLVVGEVRLFPNGLQPDGWLLADGTEGTLDLSESSPHEAVAYYEFRGL
jgi:hypothetical protein